MTEASPEKTYHDWKKDQGKLRWSLLPLEAVAAVVDILEYGALKYAPDSWRGVPDAQRRYFDALLRHLFDWWVKKERYDPESGKLHLAHVGCNALFLIALEMTQIAKEETECTTPSKHTQPPTP